MNCFLVDKRCKWSRRVIGLRGSIPRSTTGRWRLSARAGSVRANRRVQETIWTTISPWQPLGKGKEMTSWLALSFPRLPFPVGNDLIHLVISISRTRYFCWVETLCFYITKTVRSLWIFKSSVFSIDWHKKHRD